MSGEFDPTAHERDVSERFAQLGKYALFDELIDMHLDGQCSLPEAIGQFEHDLAREQEEAQA
jgi:hypothetical protein